MIGARLRRSASSRGGPEAPVEGFRDRHGRPKEIPTRYLVETTSIWQQEYHLARGLRPKPWLCREVHLMACACFARHSLTVLLSLWIAMCYCLSCVEWLAFHITGRMLPQLLKNHDVQCTRKRASMLTDYFRE